HPRVEQLPAQVVGAGRRVVGEDVAPVTAPVDGVVLGGQQPVDEPGPLVGVGVRGEGPLLLGSRQLAGEVEADAAQEGGVIGRRGQGDVAEGLAERLVHAAGDVGFGGRGRTGGQGAGQGEQTQEGGARQAHAPSRRDPGGGWSGQDHPLYRVRRRRRGCN